MIGHEDAPMRVPVNINAWRWPIVVDQVACGECRERLPVAPLTALSEVAEALSDHAQHCRAFST